jgi:hypothetical protein
MTYTPDTFDFDFTPVPDCNIMSDPVMTGAKDGCKKSSLQPNSSNTLNDNYPMRVQSAPPQSTLRPSSHKRIKLHNFKVPTPERHVVPHTPPVEADRSLIGVISEDGVDLLHLKSEGPFDVCITRDEFASLIEVTFQSDSIDTIEAIKWKEYGCKSDRPSLITKYLRRVHPFSHHYDVRFDQRPNVQAEYREDSRHRQRKAKRNPGNPDLVAWANGRCVQNDVRQKIRKYHCSSTFVVGFTLKMVKDYVGGNELIHLTGRVDGECKHVAVARTQRLQGCADMHTTVTTTTEDFTLTKFTKTTSAVSVLRVNSL